MAETLRPRQPQPRAAFGALRGHVRDTAPPAWQATSVRLGYVLRQPRTGRESCAVKPRGEIDGGLVKKWGEPAPAFPSKEEADKTDHGKPEAGGLDVAGMGRQLAAKALQVKEDKPKLQKVIEEAMA